MGRYQFKYRFRPLQYDFTHLELCLGKCCFKTGWFKTGWFHGIGAPQSLDESFMVLWDEGDR